MHPLAALDEAGRQQQGLATRTGLRGLGVSGASLTRARVAAQLVRLHRGVYAAGPLPPVPRQVVVDDRVAPSFALHVRAALLSLGGGAVAVGRSAAALHGWAMLVEPRQVEVSVPHGRDRSSLAGVRISQRRAQSRIDAAVDGHEPLAATPAVETVLTCCLDRPLLEAVVLVDSALRSGQVDLDHLHRAARGLRGRREAAKVRRVLALADPASGSVLESVLRVNLVQAGVSGMVLQHVIADGATHVLRADFAFPQSRVVVETDGRRFHSDPARDQDTDNVLARLGWRVLRYGWSDVVHDGERVVAEILSALAA